MSKQPTKKDDEESGAVVSMSGSLPAHLSAELAEYAGAGVSDRTEDFTTPFLTIAQSSSPQLKRQEASYIQGMEQGDIFNSATGEFWRGSEGVLVIQWWFQKAMVEWIPRVLGGGYVATHDIDTPLLKEFRWTDDKDPRGRMLLSRDEKTQLVDTSYHFVTLAETGESAVVSMTVTSLGCSRTWQTLMKRIKLPTPNGLVNAPSFARVYRLKTAYKSMEKGDFYVWTVSDAGWAAGTAEYGAAYELARKQFVHAREHGVTMGRPPDAADASSEAGTTIDGEVPI